jgi:hypothetical protein
MLKEKGFNFGVKEVRMSFKRLGYKSTRVIHYKRNDAKDTKKIVPNIIGGIYDCNTPFHFFSTDTSYLRTIDAPKDWSYMGGTIDMCTKFAFIPDLSFYNDNELVNSAYAITPLKSGDVMNEDRGSNILSKINLEYLFNRHCFISAGKIGRSTDNREVEYL